MICIHTYQFIIFYLKHIKLSLKSYERNHKLKELFYKTSKWP